jgi:hypothetical protein
VDSSIRGRRFDGDDTSAQPEFEIAGGAPCDQGSISAAMSTQGESFVVWESRDSGAADDSYRDIHGRLVSRDGIPTGTAFRVNTTTFQEQYAPSIAGGPEGQFIVVWESGYAAESVETWSIRAQRLSTTPRCGRPVSGGTTPTATDALAVLQAAVGSLQCEICMCDVDSNGTITAADALRTLQRAVGGAFTLICVACF